MTCLNMKTVALAVTCLASVASAQAQSLLTEGFESVATLTSSGWTFATLSTLPASPGWGQGDSSNFPAQAGTANSFAFSGFAVNGAVDGNGDPTGAILARMTTPTIALDKDVALSFWARTVSSSDFPDRLTVSVLIGGVTSELLSINNSLLRRGFPARWTEYSIDLGAQGAGKTGKFIFEYNIPNAVTQGNYIGVDTLSVQVVPEPGTWLMMGLGLAGLGLLRRRSA
jgi:hypothetical protein